MVWLTMAAVVAAAFCGMAAADYPDEGCFWTGSCVSGWSGGCGEKRVIVAKSQNCAGLCPSPQYPPCPLFTTHFQCCNQMKPRVGAVCPNCDRRVDFGKAYICCEDCSEPVITDKETGAGFCMTGARLALTLKPVDVFKWDTGAWENCSSSCGGGTRKRKVACRKVDHLSGKLSGPNVDSENCGEAPAMEEACNLHPCSQKEVKKLHTSQGTERKRRHMSGWLIALISIFSFAAVAAMVAAGYVYYQRYQTKDQGFVYVMLEGYN